MREAHDDVAIAVNEQGAGLQCTCQLQGGQQGAGFGFVVAAAVRAALREFVAATIRFQQECAEADMAGVRAGAAIAPSLPEMLFVHAHMVASKAVFVLISIIGDTVSK